MRRGAVSSWVAGLSLVWASLVAVVPAQAATTITLKAKGAITVCADDGASTLTTLSGGSCVGSIVTLTQAFEVGSNSLIDTANDPSLSFLADSMTSTIDFAGGSLTFTSVFPDTLGFLTLSTLGLGNPAELTSSATQLLSAGQAAFTQMSVLSTTSPVITSANPLQSITYTTLPSDATFGAVYYSSFDAFEERWSFTAGRIESIQISVQTDGTTPEPATLALLLVALGTVALVRRQRLLPASSRRGQR